MTDKKRLVIVDGNSLLYRAYFAVRYLSTKDGTPTNALYGLAQMLLKLQEENFDCGIIAFDTGKPTFRHEEYKEYKAQRPPTPDDLRAQMPLSRDLAEAFGYTKLELDGFEGDDVIGTMARKAAAEGMET
ncbi:MAG: DNA polymerase I, partial [Abditibacteriota bacterium]|nr:DNA polymerase I [Abditibacteriota bacterium]